MLLIGLITTFRSFFGWKRNSQWNKLDRNLSLSFTISLDLQLFVGLVLFLFYSNWGLKAIVNQGFSFVMRQEVFRFFAIEHGVIMLLSFILAHLGNSFLKKVDESGRKFKRAFIFGGLTFVLILAGIPWSRPLFPNL